MQEFKRMLLSRVCWWLEQVSLIAVLIEIASIKYSNDLQSRACREVPQTSGSKVSLFLCHPKCKRGKKLFLCGREMLIADHLRSYSFQSVLDTAAWYGYCPSSWTLPLAGSEEHGSIQTNFSSSGFVSSTPAGLISYTSTRWRGVAAQMSVEGNFEMCCL